MPEQRQNIFFLVLLKSEDSFIFRAMIVILYTWHFESKPI